MNDTITCPICNKEFKQLTSHIRTHKITIQKFKSLYPTVPLLNQQGYKDRINSGNISGGNGENMRQIHEKFKKQYLNNPKICPTCGNVIEYHQRANTYCSRSCKQIKYNTGRKRSQETKNKISLSVSKNPSGFALLHKLGLPVSRKYPNKIYNILDIELPRDENSNRQVKRTCLKCLKEYITIPNRNLKYCSRTCSSKQSGGYRIGSGKAIKSIFKGFKMDSNAELDFAKCLDKNQINWIKNKSQFFEYEFENKSHKYYPDFFLPDFNLWVEIKGKYFERPNDDAKLKSVVNIIKIMSTEIKDNTFIINKILRTRGGSNS